MEGVFVDNFLGNNVKLKFHIFGIWEVIIQVEIFTSATRHLAPGVEITLPNRHFAVVTVSVAVLNMPGKSRRFPPTGIRVRWVSDLCSLMSQTRRP